MPTLGETATTLQPLSAIIFIWRSASFTLYTSTLYSYKFVSSFINEIPNHHIIRNCLKISSTRLIALST